MVEVEQEYFKTFIAINKGHKNKIGLRVFTFREKLKNMLAYSIERS